MGCVNKVAERIGALTGAKHFPHPFGCSQLGDDQLVTQKILAGMVNHPNCGGALVLGLGCENNNIEELNQNIEEVTEVTEETIEENTEEVNETIEQVEETVNGITFKCSEIPTKDLYFTVLSMNLSQKTADTDSVSGILTMKSNIEIDEPEYGQIVDTSDSIS